MSGPALVVLAAGMGSRYGGVKQLEGFGAGGETLLDYAVYDALRSGFSEVVFIIRAAIEADFRESVIARMGAKVPHRLAFQEPDKLIPKKARDAARDAGRTKPWGTAHALLCAREQISGPFAVINADDFYGREAFAAMAAFLSSAEGGSGQWGALVPYRVDRTLSPSGTVARGVCLVEGGELRAVVERTAIERKGEAVVASLPGGAAEELPVETPVSMNFWGFPSAALDGIGRYFADFLKTSAGDPKAEAYLPNAVDSMIREGTLRMRALEADSEWFGVTYREDREAAVRRIRALVESGRYPASLWS